MRVSPAFGKAMELLRRAQGKRSPGSTSITGAEMQKVVKPLLQHPDQLEDRELLILTGQFLGQSQARASMDKDARAIGLDALETIDPLRPTFPDV